MRIAIPLSEGQLAEEFSRSGEFAIYDVHDETRAVGYVGRQSFAEPGCSRSATFLRTQCVEVVLAHHVSEKAVNHLLEVGIVAIQDAPILTADALISHLVSGTLKATPPDVAMHGGGCQSGGCGHCSGHGHEHGAEEGAADFSCQDDAGCGPADCCGPGACGH